MFLLLFWVVICVVFCVCVELVLARLVIVVSSEVVMMFY